MNFTLLDIFLAIPLLYGLIKGGYRGLVGEITSIVGLVGGLLAAFYFSEMVFNVLAQFVNNPGIEIRTLSFILVFIVVMIVVNLAGKVISKTLDLIALGAVNHILGAAFGFTKWLCITSVAVYFFAMLQQEAVILQPDILAESQLYQKLLSLSSYLSDYLDQAAGVQPPASS